ncbi:hypothetical protein [Pseudodesulfovibrio sp. zrk46]|uniref:hypothetical protein n=1 Tax=Pseudodesulfovibrio sp. zrk46 TaxID=2725288 RepID=UPI001449F35D|nr:hypothetical protein [Pseudodesulfovibrio sp. zrk46]QJB56900.1 hypothetical protein HFN16_11015 [Pseudodesulfovibrio sp. zrk46]
MAQDMVITYRSPESINDSRYNYDTEALELALEKTSDTWGGYSLLPSPVMNFPRAIDFLKGHELDNPMFKLSASAELCEEFEYVPFPIDLGIVGYRMFFVSDTVNYRLSKVKSVKELKEFSIGQGAGWLDGEILEAAGFKVRVAPNYESLFNMVAEQRFELFPRGINEVELEFKSHDHIPGFMLNRTIGIHYPLPRFFFTNKNDKKAAQRIFEGLVMAYEDGSLKELWMKHYGPSLEFAKIGDVTFFDVENPLLKGVDPSYKKYMLKFGSLEK